MQTSSNTQSQGLLRPAVMLFVLLSVITGLVYPLLTTGVAGVLFPRQASGSLIERDGQVVGSELIGQSFGSPGYFWSRPSATATMAYNGAASGGSNLGPTNPALAQAVQERIAALRAVDPANAAPVPVDLVTASGSGLDPHISPAAADYQAGRVARARGMSEDAVRELVRAHTDEPWLGLIGDPAVNVLRLNLALDRAAPEPRR
ncbi:potassium-transporting ATPase subunit KdpC [Bordetella genomosp. 13]|uniref:Potassium-transporting ATPase KdpC subunit n=1 Tax=Bordetella genomosp. 13 TaxID=463040 RepID=A0A1W6ZFE8_9BORD|nr:potassium-transporting ATPase subunit KdpC [Bordetella genomosp. 13]ARP96059.1 potassium-transporting ATPase subunit C [Bordetella genomosp. 13]